MIHKIIAHFCQMTDQVIQNNDLANKTTQIAFARSKNDKITLSRSWNSDKPFGPQNCSFSHGIYQMHTGVKDY